jgi:protein-tyrosine phosphatase
MPTRSREVVWPFERLANFRDVGGLATTDGRTVRTGLLFRSNEPSRMTDKDLVTLRKFGIRLVCDLRSAKESRRRRGRFLADGSIRLVNIPLHEDASQDGSLRKMLVFMLARSGGEQFREFSRRYYQHVAFEQTSRMREIITLFSRDDSWPALIHCTAGKDRTGFLAAIIQLLVGVPYRSVMEDYLLTNDHFAPQLAKVIRAVRIATLFRVSPERLRLLLMAHPESLDDVHRNLVEKHGSIESYLREACGIDQATLERLKQRLLA